MTALPDKAKTWIDDHEFATIATIQPDGQPQLSVVWLERDGVPVFLNDAKAVEHDYPGAAAWPQGGTATLFFVITDVDGFHARIAPHARRSRSWASIRAPRRRSS